MKDIPEGTICERSGCTHPATVNWVGSGGTLAFIHGMARPWCECCSIREQVKHCEHAVKRLAKLRKKLTEACKDVR